MLTVMNTFADIIELITLFLIVVAAAEYMNYHFEDQKEDQS